MSKKTIDRETGEVFDFVPRSYGRHKQVNNLRSFPNSGSTISGYNKLDYWGEQKRLKEKQRSLKPSYSSSRTQNTRSYVTPSYSKKVTKKSKVTNKKSFYKKAKPILKKAYYKTKRVLYWLDNF